MLRPERWRPAGWLGGVLAAALYLRFAPIPPIPKETTPTIVDRNGVVLYEPLGSTGTLSSPTSVSTSRERSR